MKFHKILVDDLPVQRDQTPLRLGDAAGVQFGLRYFVRVQADDRFWYSIRRDSSSGLFCLGKLASGLLCLGKLASGLLCLGIFISGVF